MNLDRIPKIQVGLTPRVASCDPRNIVTVGVKRYSFQTYDAVLYFLSRRILFLIALDRQLLLDDQYTVRLNLQRRIC